MFGLLLSLSAMSQQYTAVKSELYFWDDSTNAWKLVRTNPECGVEIYMFPQRIFIDGVEPTNILMRKGYKDISTKSFIGQRWNAFVDGEDASVDLIKGKDANFVMLCIIPKNKKYNFIYYIIL